MSKSTRKLPMGHLGIGVRFPLLSSVFRGAAWSGVLSVAILASMRGASGLDVRTERMIGPGVKCIMLHRDTGPNVIRIIEADGNSVYVRPGATFASDRGLRAAPVSAQAQQATRPERYPIAGVNGDFFVHSPGPYEADPS